MQWRYMNSSHTPPATGQAGATLQFIAPQTPGTYEVRWFANNGSTRLATSSNIVVATQPGLSIYDVSIVEGNSGTSTATFTVTLAPANPSQTVTVDFATTNVTATVVGGDYVAATGTLSFAPSVTSRTVAVTVNGDTAIELTETFVVNLTNAANALISDGLATGTITNDDLAGAPAVVVNTPNVSPGGTIGFTVTNGLPNPTDWVTLSPAAGTDNWYVDWQYPNGLKTAPTSAVSNATLQFPAPTTPGTYDIRLFANNRLTKLVTSAPITVASQPTLTIGDVTVTEGNAGTTTATFTVTLAPVNASQTVTVGYATANGTATTADNDYVAASDTLTFDPAVASRTISVTINGDVAVEPNETFLINLANATNALIGDAQATGTITSDDLRPARR